ncbi:7991_t:CDS:2 [Funneliformis caledonium]|uniref:7991_t:CDS:1 n=2 Tax=Funneliformis TaxID=1117308 RepID=A0A9N8V553_9GLOM|nr:7991_t:CDS:2 [Funneliformis caledonium]CAG8449630.1 11708_t:CDS:2 [Funneliformis mosseae]
MNQSKIRGIHQKPIRLVQPFLRIYKRVTKRGYQPEYGSAEWSVYQGGELWLEGLKVYHRNSHHKGRRIITTQRDKDACTETLTYFFNALVINESGSYISAARDLIPELFKQKDFIIEVRNIVKIVTTPGSFLGVYSEKKFTVMLGLLRNQLQHEDPSHLDKTLDAFQHAIMSSFVWLKFVPDQAQTVLFTRCIIYIASMRKLLGLYLPGFIEGFAIQALNGIPVPSVTEDRSIPCLVSESVLTSDARTRIYSKIITSSKWAFLLSLEMLSLYYFRFAQTLVQTPNANSETVRNITQCAIDILECSKIHPTFPIDIPPDDHDSLGSDSPDRVKLHFPLPFYQLYHPKYQFILATVLLDLKEFKQAKLVFSQIGFEYGEINRPMAARSLYKVATCIVFGSDSDAHPGKFDIVLFREAATKANEYYETLEEQGIWVQIAEVENVKKPVQDLLRDLPKVGLSKTARLEMSPINNARIMTLDPEYLKGNAAGNSNKSNNKSTANNSKSKGEESVTNKCDYCEQPSATMQCPCKVVRYCDKTCQKNDWKAHKGVCSLRKK